MDDWIKARHWEFLRPHFERLRGRLTSHYDPRFPSSHPVRVGLDMRDWWIRVIVVDALDAATVSAVRDALLVVGAFAQVNRGCCFQYLQTFSLWRPAPFMDLQDARFLPRFRVCVSEMVRAQDDDTAALIKILLGDQDGDSVLQSVWAQVLDMQARVGRAPVLLQPVEVFVDVDVGRVTEARQPQFVQCVTEAIEKNRATQQENRLMEATERITPVLSLSAMDLTLTNTPLSLATIEALCRLVKLKVPLNTVEFPVASGFRRGDFRDLAWRLAWCELLCALTDQDTTALSLVEPDAKPFVRRLIVPSECLHGSLLNSLFSALVFARGVGELQLGRLVSGLDRLQERGAQRGVDPSFWHWFGCFLRPDAWSSSHPIETISLVGARIDAGAMETLKTVARLTPSVQHVAKRLVAHDVELGQLSERNCVKTVSIAAGSTLKLYDTRGRAELVTTKALTGRLLHEADDTSLSVLIVPGLGVCSVAGKLLPVESDGDAPQVLSTKVVLKNVKFVSPPEGHQSLTVLGRFLRLVGSSLEGIHVSTPRMTGITMETIVRTCPNLESLSLGGAHIASFDFLWDAYARGCKISSLEFATDTVLMSFNETHAVESLLRQLISPGTPASRTLTRLSFVRHDFLSILCPLFDEMLATNQTLTHFWYVGCRSHGFLARWMHERHHGERLRESPPIPLDLRQRLAFLSVLRRFQRNNKVGQVDSFVGALILRFAATRPHRSVVRSLTN